jgi:hypothetical protein
VSLRARFIAYLTVVHLLLAAAGAALFIQNPLWLIAVETVLFLSLGIGVALTLAMQRNLRAVHAGVGL